MKSYRSYVVGALAGVLVAYALTRFFTLTGAPEICLFAILPAFGGALFEQMAIRHSLKSRGSSEKAAPDDRHL